MFDYDIAVIGGGPGGHAAALRAAKLGARVTLIEKASLGGTCLNRGCIPTKYLAKHAALLLEVNAAQALREYTGNLTANFSQIIADMNAVMLRLRNSMGQTLSRNNVVVQNGDARLTSPHSIEMNGLSITAKHTIVATGSKPFILPIPGINAGSVVTTDQVLQLQALPASMVVVGGNYVGLEFATILNAFGVKVTVLEKQSSLLQPLVEEEISRRFMRTIIKQGVEVVANADVQEIRREELLTRVLYRTADCQKEFSAQLVLMATGRQPCTDGLGLAEIGVKMKGKAIDVNKCLQTNVNSIYAVGDVIGKNMLAHVASYEGEIAVDNALGMAREVDYTVVPSCVFVMPEIASVGITEAVAEANRIHYKVGKLPMNACSRSVIAGETSGIIKMICDADNGDILGLHIMGHHASDLIAEGALAIKLRATATDIAGVIHSHPTFSEILHDTAAGLTANMHDATNAHPRAE